MSDVAGPPPWDPDLLGDPLAAFPAVHRWCRTFPGEERQLGMVRRWLASLLPECPARDDVALVVTELAANAVQHTASGRGGEFAVDVAVSQVMARVCVTDGGSPEGPRVVADPDGERGRGLVVVANLSARTGVCGDHRGRRVWADVPWVDASATAPAPSPGAADQDTLAGIAGRCPGMPSWSGRSPGQPARAEPAGLTPLMTPGLALRGLLTELARAGWAVRGMTVTRLEGTLQIEGGLLVRYGCGWLAWPAGRASARGRPLHVLHSARDPVGAARKLTRSAQGRQTAGRPGRVLP